MLITRLGADQTLHYRLSRSQNRSSTAASDKIDCKSHCYNTLTLYSIAIQMAPSNFSPSERLVRKRLAARLRQRRCRERKRELATTGVVPTVAVSKENNGDSKSVEISADNSTAYSSNKSTPTASPSKVAPVYVDIQSARPPIPGYGWHYPIGPSTHSRGPSFHYHHHPLHSAGYYGGVSHHHHQQPPMIPVMYAHPSHHIPYLSQAPACHYAPHQRPNSHGNQYPMPVCGPLPEVHHSVKQSSLNHRSTSDSVEPGDVSRTVSRSPSDASLQSGKRASEASQIAKSGTEVDFSDEAQNMLSSHSAGLEPFSEGMKCHSSKLVSHKKQKQIDSKNPNSLMSTEKAAVAAMLSMKSSSDESDGDSTTVSTLKSLPVLQDKTSQQHKRQRTAVPLMAAV